MPGTNRIASARRTPDSPRRPLPAGRSAFTLVELMVVVGIIALLLTILLPAINNARDAAKVASTQVLIRAVETGLESFRADRTIGGRFPESWPRALGRTSFPMPVSPHDGSTGKPFYGANLLVWALAGADLLGTPGFRDRNSNGTWYDESGPGPGGLYSLSDVPPARGSARSSNSNGYPSQNGSRAGGSALRGNRRRDPAIRFSFSMPSTSPSFITGLIQELLTPLVTCMLACWEPITCRTMADSRAIRRAIRQPRGTLASTSGQVWIIRWDAGAPRARANRSLPARSSMPFTTQTWWRLVGLGAPRPTC